jgi:hypothetical protein
MTVSTATTSDELALRAGPSVHGGLRKAAVDQHAARQARADAGGAQPEQLAVGVDFVVVLRRIGLGRAESFREADEHGAQGRGGDVEVVGEADLRKPELREPALDVADDRDAVLVEVEETDGEDAAQHDEERAGNDRREHFDPDDEGESDDADDEREPAR